MTKEHAYAYEAGYRDGSTHYELEHCPACKNVADLQEALEENAKLREFAADLWRFTKTACGRYPRLFDPLAPGGQTVNLNPLESFEQRFHEVMGVRQDGDQV